MNLFFKHKFLLRAPPSSIVQLLFVLVFFWLELERTLKKGIEGLHGRHWDAFGGLWWVALVRASNRATLGSEKDF